MIYNDRRPEGLQITFNPPYQDQSVGDNETFAPPVYNKFMDAAYQVADKVELIHPARFLFNVGSTPKPMSLS